MADPVTVKLRKPVVFAGQTVAELVIQPMKPKFLRNIPKDASDEDKGLLLLSRMSGQPASVIDELDMDDFAEACEALAVFQGASRATGRTSSQP